MRVTYEKQLLVEYETKLQAALNALHDHNNGGYIELAEKMKLECIRLVEIVNNLKRVVQS